MRGKARWCRWCSPRSSCSRTSHPTPAGAQRSVSWLPFPSRTAPRPSASGPSSRCPTTLGRSLFCSARRPRGLHSRGDLPLAPDCSTTGKEVRKNPSRIRALKATRRNASPHERTDTTDTGELRSLSRSALPAGESSPFASEVEIHPIHTCP